MPSPKEWILGLPGHEEVISFEEVLRLVQGGQLRPTDLVKKIGQPWRAANEVQELAKYFSQEGGDGEEEERQPAPRRSSRVDPLSKTTRYSRRRTPAETPGPSVPSSARKKEAAPPSGTDALPEPMTPKYFSPADLMRSASSAFDPKRLVMTAIMTVFLAVALSMAFHFSEQADNAVLQKGLSLLGIVVVLLGGGIVFTLLAFVTRKQLEGEPWGVTQVIGYARSNLKTAVLHPILALIPSLIGLGLLWLLGLLRNAGPTFAAVLRAAYLFPLAFSLLAVFGIFLYQGASMLVPAAAAVEGAGLRPALEFVRRHIRRQLARVVLHGVVVTVAVGVVGTVCLMLVGAALALPDLIFPGADGENALKIYKGWRANEGAFRAWVGLAYGLGLVLPVSLFGTLGTLSYLALRHPENASVEMETYDSAQPGPDETKPSSDEPEA